jgi:hypothetical protein
LNDILAPRRWFCQSSNFNDLVKGGDTESSRRIQGLSAVGVLTILLAKDGRVRARKHTGENHRWALVDACPWPVRRQTLDYDPAKLRLAQATTAKRETKVSDLCAGPERQLLQDQRTSQLWLNTHFLGLKVTPYKT